MEKQTITDKFKLIQEKINEIKQLNEEKDKFINEIDNKLSEKSQEAINFFEEISENLNFIFSRLEFKVYAYFNWNGSFMNIPQYMPSGDLIADIDFGESSERVFIPIPRLDKNYVFPEEFESFLFDKIQKAIDTYILSKKEIKKRLRDIDSRLDELNDEKQKLKKRLKEINGKQEE